MVINNKIHVFWFNSNYDASCMEYKVFEDEKDFKDWLNNLEQQEPDSCYGIHYKHKETGEFFNFYSVDELIVIKGIRLTVKPKEVEVVTQYDVI